MTVERPRLVSGYPELGRGIVRYADGLELPIVGWEVWETDDADGGADSRWVPVVLFEGEVQSAPVRGEGEGDPGAVALPT